MHRIVINLLTLVLLGSLSSCSVERKLAREFVNNAKSGAVMLLAPDFVYLNSYKVPYFENFDLLLKHEKDSVTFFNSDVVQYIDDSLYLSNYMKSLSWGLQFYGLTVYKDAAADKFMNSEDREGYIINVVQLQLEEYLDSIADATSYDYEMQEYLPLYVTALNYNNWFEVTRVNHIQSAPVVLFNSRTMTDQFSGYVRYYPLTGDFNYEYTVDSLKPNDVYIAASDLGYLHAQWMFDYMMNDYVSKHVPEGRPVYKTFTYLRSANIITNQKKSPFTVITE